MLQKAAVSTIESIHTKMIPFCVEPSTSIQRPPRWIPKNRFAQHVLFWIVIYFFDVFVFGWDSQNYPLFFKMVLFEMPAQMLLAYVIMYSGIPLYFQKRYWTAAAIVIVTFLICSFAVHAMILYLSNYYPKEVPLFSFSKLLVRGFYLFANAAIAVIIKLVKMWYQNELRVGELQSVRLEAELKMLREQVNPHFLFNTLNNMYGLVERNAKHAQEMILGLSRIMHYMLYESNLPTTELKKEMDCIRDYVELEKIRYSGNLSVSVYHDTETEQLQIVPLLLFPLVENSFKHGASEAIESAWVNIQFTVDKSHFVFKIENTRTCDATANHRPGGIGLTNVKRRLELAYEGDHSIDIIDGHDTYLVVLKISLSRMTQPAIA